MKKLAVSFVLSFLCAIFLCYASDAIGAPENKKPALKIHQKEGEKPYDFSTILVKFKDGVTKKQRHDLAILARGKFKDKNEDGIDDRYQHILSGRLALIELEGTKGLNLATRALRALQNHPFVDYAEYNYLHSIDLAPDDPDFGELWGLHNIGQSGGTSDADIDAPEAWDITTGSSEVIVAVIDTGVDYHHEDLATNMWTNPGEIAGDGVDNDGNGYVDDIYGMNSIIEGSGDPMDDNGHGSHCSGTIGAVGNNTTGVTGVNWDIKIVALKFLGADGYGDTADAIECIDYAVGLKVNQGVDIRVFSNSWGGGGFSQGLLDAIEDAHAAGMLFVASAGNNGSNNDTYPHYPSSYEAANLVAVGYTDHNDNRSPLSNYGANSVDLFAPGSSILSTLPGNDYGIKSGTSMAAPHVSGVAALMLSENNTLTVAELKDYLLNSGDLIPALSGLCVSGKRLNAYNSLPPLWLSSDPTSRTILQEEFATYTINLASVDATLGEVFLSSISNPVIDANIAFNPNPVTPGSSSEMKVSTSADTVPGDYLITVTGDSDSIDKTTAVSLKVRPPGWTTISYSSQDTPIDIPDCADDLTPGEIDSTIEVADSLDVDEPIECEVHITHTWISDLIVRLKSADGTEVILHDREGGSADNIHRTYFLTEFISENSGGFWTLMVSDNFPQDAGTLDGWTLRIGGIPTDPVNRAPMVTITAPADGSTFTEGESVTFTGTANDYNDGDISSSIQWTSSEDGPLDSGASITSTLTVGTHTITAEATDGDESGSDSITVTIVECDSDGICGPGENCNNCPTDCIGDQGGGTCAACFKGKCDGSCNPRKEGSDCADCAVSYCCGDGICEGAEDLCTCYDCGKPEVSEEGFCTDGVDNDCDEAIDCADLEDCASDPVCECLPRGQECMDNSECCSKRCFRGNCK
jgi:subtilisin family serine protease/subtilisin-like proprotein convertase family protein